MINLYIGRSCLPKNKELIWDVEKFFGQTMLEDKPFVNKVLNVIEQGKYQSQYSFVDRFGYGLRSSCLSTGSKILICLDKYKEYIINATELGSNGISLITECCDCNLLFLYNTVAFSKIPDEGITVNGYKCNSVEELNYEISISEV